MKVITLIGLTQCGKTTIITDVFKELCLNGAKEHVFLEEGNDKKDFKALVTFNGKKIAFNSIGYIADKGHLYSEYILSGIVFASEKEADILINTYTEPFPEFSQAVYENIIGKNNLFTVSVSKTSNSNAIKNQIISML